MTWPTVAVGTTNVDAGTDSPASARTDIKDAMDKLNQMMAHVSAFAATLLDDANAAAFRSTLGAAASGANTDITSLNAPALGAATATTQAVGDNTTKVATTAFVIGQAATLAPAALGTAAVGASLKYAREDHVHTAPTGGVTSLNGQTGAITNTSLDAIGSYRLADNIMTAGNTVAAATIGASAGTWRCMTAAYVNPLDTLNTVPGIFVRIS